MFEVRRRGVPIPGGLADVHITPLDGSVAARVAIVVVWLVVSVIAGTTAFLALNGKSLANWVALMSPMLIYYGGWLIYSILIYNAIRRFSGSVRAIALSIPFHVVALIVFSGTMPFLIAPDNWQDWLYGSRAPAFHLLSVMIYALCVVGSFALWGYSNSQVLLNEVHHGALREEQLASQLNAAKIEALKMQINPHFLFNTLNSIAALVESRHSDRAYEALVLLGDLLRSALSDSDSKLVELEKELQFVRQYIELEKIRFGSRLSFKESISPECLAAMVPTFILQPIVENAIKHAVSTTAEPTTISIEANVRENNRIVLTVSDDGLGFSKQKDGSCGIGLMNVNQRLILQFGDEYPIRRLNSPDGGAVVEVTLPIQMPVNRNG